MEKHLLVTISEKESAWHGVRFVGNFFSNKDALKVTLLYIVPRLPGVNEGEGLFGTAFEDEELFIQYETDGKKALEAAKRELIGLGLSDENVNTKIQIEKFSTVLDIIQEGAEGLYDAVVLGHRALSWIEGAFEQSTTKQLLQEKFNFPVWICRKTDEVRKNVLVCVDTASKSCVIADHVGYILSEEDAHDVTLIHVNTTGTNTNEDIEDLMAKVMGELTKNGFPESRVTSKILDQKNVRKVILKEAEKGQFAAVAIGSTDAGSRTFQTIFTGALCNEILKNLENAALWICD